MTVMRRVVVYPDRIAVEAADIPAPGPDEALVRTLVAGVCGSDLHAARGSHPFVPLPYRPGHEVVGIVEAVGPGSPLGRATAPCSCGIDEVRPVKFSTSCLRRSSISLSATRTRAAY